MFHRCQFSRLSQQRTRRYKSGQDYDENAVFNSVVITPGTNFMIELDAFLKKWLDINKLNIPPNTIYSSHMVPGEGEHKIMDFIRQDLLF
ncbi:unnamed protein product, partial [marine sediment metagenome]